MEDEPLNKINHSHPHVVAYLCALVYLFRELPDDQREKPLTRLSELVDFVMLESKENMPESGRIDLRKLHALFLRMARQSET